MSVMQSVMETVFHIAEEHGASQVTKIQLRIGERAGISIDALRFAFDLVSQNTLAEGSVLAIDTVPLRGECLDCGHQFQARDGFLVCDQCEGYAKILSGQELNIESIEVKES